ncbi:MAG TPA: hypothetical protein VGG74_14635 [Kofleriaceae bacterium]
MRAAPLLAVMLGAAAASAQPLDPYAPAPPAKPSTPAPTPTPAPAPMPAPAPPTPAPPDPVLAEQVAQSLVDRAQELLDAKVFADAKQLAVEALVKSPSGPAADRAKLVIKQANAALGIVEPSEQPPPPPPPPDTRPIEDPTKVDQPAPADNEHRASKTTSAVHGGLYGAAIGATIGSFFSHNEAAGAVPMGIAFGAAGAIFGPMIASHYHADEAQVREVGSGILWGGVFGGLMFGTIQGADGGAVSGHVVLVGSAVGATLGGLGGLNYALNDRLTRGDVALVDTLAGIGTAGGLTIGMLMQPAQREAYSLNAAVGAAAGVIAGVIAGPQTNTTQRRMLRVAGMAAAGGAVPFLILAADPHSGADQRVTGALATLGLVGGAWLGFYLTRHVDEGLDVPDHKPAADDAPPAVVGLNSDGRVSVGGIGLAPLSPQLSTDRGAALNVFAGRF